jgi:pimeloyl-ACP methyl ester carboxylesterase
VWIGDVGEYTKHYCVYALDIPGEPGKSEERQYSLKCPVYSEWLNEVMQKLQLSKASLVGISLGAWLAISFSVKYPQNVEKLVLMCPSGIGPQRISFMIRAIPLMLMGDKGFNKISRIVNGDDDIPKEALEYTKLIARNFNLRTEPVPIFTEQELKRLTMPVLLFAGKKDVLLQSEKTIKRLEASVPAAVTNLLPNHGHVLVGFASKIVDFLNEKPQTNNC